MMDLLRKFSKSWLALLLIGLLVLSFAIWGISGSIIFGAQTTVAQVGNTSVDVNAYRFAYDNQLLNLSRNLNRRLSQQEANALGLRESVLQQVVAGAVLDETISGMGLGASEESVARDIAQDPNFRDLSGSFSRNTLNSFLRQIGMSEGEYIRNRKVSSLRNQLVDGTASSMAMPKAYLDAFRTYRDERRVFDYVTLGPELVTDLPEPTSTQIEEYYEANKPQYEAPEYRKIIVLKVEPTDVMKPEEVSEDALLAAYESRKPGLKRPERREIQQLVLSASSRETVEKQLADGVSFETIVSEQGKSLNDISLGTLRKTELPDEAVADAAFSAVLNQPTAIVEGIFGPVVLRVTKIEAETTTPFEEIKDQIRNDIAAEDAVDEVFATFDAVEDERGAGEPLVSTAEKLNLTTRTIDAIDRRGLDPDGNPVTGIPQLQELLTEVFQAEPGDDTRALEIGENGFLWFDVEEIIPERQKPLDEVRDDVIAAWKSAETDGQIIVIANGIKEKVRGGADFNNVLAETLPTDSLGQNITFKTSDPIARRGQTPDIPVNAVQAGFAIAEGKMDTVEIGNNRHLILRVSGIQAEEGEQFPEEAITGINQAASDDIVAQMVDDLQSRESVSINQSAIELAFSPTGGRQPHGY